MVSPVPEPRRELLELLDRETRRPVSEAVAGLAEDVRHRHGPAVQAVLFYGSGLRGGDLEDLVLDFYVLVDRYDRAFERRSWALLNALLPPNVFYREATVGRRRLRCKYAVISLRQFRRAASRRSLTPYIWSRFAQPCRILYAHDEATRNAVLEALADAAVTFMARTLPLLPGEQRPRDIWASGVGGSYRSELRAEPPGHADALYEAAAAHLERLTPPAARLSGVPVDVTEDTRPPRLYVRPRRSARIAARLRLLAQVSLGKALSLLRLVKAAFTFEGGVDYVLWKVERHSGVHVEPSPWQKRHPLIGGWGLFWRLYRRGAFR